MSILIILNHLEQLPGVDDAALRVLNDQLVKAINKAGAIYLVPSVAGELFFIR